MTERRIGFIGAGQIATALGAGFVRAGLVKPADLVAADPSSEAAAHFAQTTGGRALTSNVEVAQRAEVLFLAVKPQQMVHVIAELKGKIAAETLVVSIAAGIRLATLEQGLGEHLRFVRVMPNTPCLVHQGASAYSVGRKATDADGELVHELLSAVGWAVAVEEKLLDAVTGLSGSGPAFVYVMIEALSDGGVRMGLPRAVATALAAQTVLRRRPNGPHYRRASRRAQGPRSQSRRDDDRRFAGPGRGGHPRRTDGRGGGRYSPLDGNGRRLNDARFLRG